MNDITRTSKEQLPELVTVWRAPEPEPLPQPKTPVANDNEWADYFKRQSEIWCYRFWTLQNEKRSTENALEATTAERNRWWNAATDRDVEINRLTRNLAEVSAAYTELKLRTGHEPRSESIERGPRIDVGHGRPAVAADLPVNLGPESTEPSPPLNGLSKVRVFRNASEAFLTSASNPGRAAAVVHDNTPGSPYHELVMAKIEVDAMLADSSQPPVPEVRFKPAEWIALSDRLPTEGMLVALANVDRFRSDDQLGCIKDIGVLKNGGHDRYWSTHGQLRAMCLEAFTHWSEILEPCSGLTKAPEHG